MNKKLIIGGILLIAGVISAIASIQVLNSWLMYGGLVIMVIGGILVVASQIKVSLK